jgi:hypothetical protein
MGMVHSSRRMQSITNDSFGPLVAYLLPGATAILGVAPYSPMLQRWFAALPPDAPTIGGLVYLTLASLAAGMTVNAIRWGGLDTIHAKTGLRLPNLDFSKLAGREQALALLIDIHYKHYQFHGSMLIATAFAYVGYRFSTGFTWTGLPLDLAFVLIEIIFFLMSRDCLRKYYGRASQLLGR